MKALLVVMALALGAAVWWLSPGQGPAALLMTVVLASGPLYLITRSRSADKEFLLQIFIAALLARLGVGTLIYVSNGQSFFGGDAYQYDYFGHELLMVWRGWNLRSVSAVTGEVSGYGMLYIVAAIYAAVGRNMLAIQFFNSVLGACTVPLLYLCTLHIYGSARVARVAAFFVAFFPSLVLWSSQGLKDGPIVFLLVVTMLMTLRLGEKLRAGYAAGLAAALLCLLTFRFYIFYMVAAAAGGALLIGMRKVSTRALAQQLAVLLGVGLLLTYFGVMRTAQEHFDTYGTLEKVQQTREYFAKSAKSGFGEDLDVSTAEGALTAIPLGMVYLLFAPFPWQLGSLRQSITLPEMVIWWAAFPLLCLGVWFTLRHRLRQALPIIIFTTMLTLAYSIFQGNVGTAYRQRSQLLVFYFIFVAVGFVLMKEGREDKRRGEALAREAERAQLRAPRRPGSRLPRVQGGPVASAAPVARAGDIPPRI